MPDMCSSFDESIIKMYKPIGILILNLFLVINAHENDSKTVHSATATNEDVNLLRTISPEEALPVILFETEDRKALEFPVGLTEAEIKDKRLIFGTKFYSTLPSVDQILFCQNPTGEVCLVPTDFEEKEVLQCKHEPVSVLEETPNTPDEGNDCGPKGTGTEYRFAYRLCPAKQPHIFQTNFFRTYSFCYDSSSKKILFVDHQIFMAKLLSEKLLTREREIKFKLMKETHESIDSEYYNDLDDAAELYPQYKFQKLVPAEDMALASWRKTTYHYVNIALQHEKLFELWNKINDYIRTHTIESYGYAQHNTSSIGLMTRVFDIPEDEITIPEPKNQLYNIWMKMIIYIDNRKPLDTGLAILMNNFISEKSENQVDKTLTAVQQYIDKICPENLCVNSLMTAFFQVGGLVRCCKLTNKIMRFFETEEYTKSVKIKEVLEIPGINC